MGAAAVMAKPVRMFSASSSCFRVSSSLRTHSRQYASFSMSSVFELFSFTSFSFKLFSFTPLKSLSFTPLNSLSFTPLNSPSFK